MSRRRPGAADADTLARLASLAERYEWIRAAFHAVDPDVDPEAHARAWDAHDRAYAEFARRLREADFRAARRFEHRGVAYAFTFRFGLFARTETDPLLASAYATEAPPAGTFDPAPGPGPKRRRRRKAASPPDDAELEALVRRYREAGRILDIVLAIRPLDAYDARMQARRELAEAIDRGGGAWRGYAARRRGKGWDLSGPGEEGGATGG